MRMCLSDLRFSRSMLTITGILHVAMRTSSDGCCSIEQEKNAVWDTKYVCYGSLVAMSVRPGQHFPRARDVDTVTTLGYKDGKPPQWVNI
ncbi:hypothetical protein F5Y14DRAFT_103932 [Nemania sp. NC0429]|nr:hypothetical protein F5Y14DRAFT_103932 [Nemania sp. NC0429]